ncbi:UNVERIFIED_CONTAM: hypothetical protein Scaly_0961600 [Sesamum calycinum]|uniref:AP180 N-terminal homology (ANTH) domain-containing protein n=1 Tax=Sesamum calycinum TaxID=2727403 RepID=A0AAW2QXR5_9LAMI
MEEGFRCSEGPKQHLAGPALPPHRPPPPDIQKAVIRATAHYHLSFDRRNIDRVCEWIRISPCNLRPVLWSLSNRMHKTRNWVVASRVSYLMHQHSHSRLHCVRQSGQLWIFPASDDVKAGSELAFQRLSGLYYSFLDQKWLHLPAGRARNTRDVAEGCPPSGMSSCTSSVVESLIEPASSRWRGHSAPRCSYMPPRS